MNSSQFMLLLVVVIKCSSVIHGSTLAGVFDLFFFLITDRTMDPQGSSLWQCGEKNGREMQPAAESGTAGIIMDIESVRSPSHMFVYHLHPDSVKGLGLALHVMHHVYYTCFRGPGQHK